MSLPSVEVTPADLSASAKTWDFKLRIPSGLRTLAEYGQQYGDAIAVRGTFHDPQAFRCRGLTGFARLFHGLRESDAFSQIEPVGVLSGRVERINVPYWIIFRPCSGTAGSRSSRKSSPTLVGAVAEVVVGGLAVWAAAFAPVSPW